MKVASFLDGDARVLFSRDVFFPHTGFILAGLSCKSGALSLSSFSLYLSLSFLHLHPLFPSSRPPLGLINFGGFV